MFNSFPLFTNTTPHREDSLEFSVGMLVNVSLPSVPFSSRLLVYAATGDHMGGGCCRPGPVGDGLVCGAADALC
ncbi:hypothetical protein MHYP_G00030280 [Metynnis hypsauchen]